MFLVFMLNIVFGGLVIGSQKPGGDSVKPLVAGVFILNREIAGVFILVLAVRAHCVMYT